MPTKESRIENFRPMTRPVSVRLSRRIPVNRHDVAGDRLVKLEDDETEIMKRAYRGALLSRHAALPFPVVDKRGGRQGVHRRDLSIETLMSFASAAMGKGKIAVP